MQRRSFVIGTGAAAVGAAAIGGAIWANDARRYATQVAAMRAPLAPAADAREWIRYATLAPNGHNTQSWRFAIAPGRVTIRPDLARRTPVVDPDDHHVYFSLGCAAENLTLAAAACGRAGELRFDGAGDGALVFTHDTGARAVAALATPQRAWCDAIPARQSTRNLYDGRAVATTAVDALAAAGASVPGVDAVIDTAPAERQRLHDLIIAGNTAQMDDPAFVRELKHWLRFSPARTVAQGDGLYSATSGNPSMPEWLGRRAFDATVTTASSNDGYRRQLASSSGFAVVVGARDDREHWVLAGRACQRLALQATALGMKLAFVNQPVEVAALRPDLAALVGLPGRRPDIVMRFGYGPAMPYSMRRPLDAVIDG